MILAALLGTQAEALFFSGVIGRKILGFAHIYLAAFFPALYFQKMFLSANFFH